MTVAALYILKLLSGLIALVKLMVPLILVEAAWNRETMPLVARLRALLFLVIYGAARVAFFMAVLALLRGVDLPRLVTAPPWMGAILALLVYDFCYYWMHRAQHAIPVLWRFHKVHHSIEHMGAGTGYHHVSQIAVEAVCLTLPLVLLTQPGSSSWVVYLIGIHGAYLHTTSRLHLGPLGYLIGDNRTHRVHHSTDPAHFDRNFGVPTLLWDRVFRTAYFPRYDEWPNVGLADHPEPVTIVQFLRGSPDQPRGNAPVGAVKPEV